VGCVGILLHLTQTRSIRFRFGEAARNERDVFIEGEIQARWAEMLAKLNDIFSSDGSQRVRSCRLSLNLVRLYDGDSAGSMPGIL